MNIIQYLHLQVWPTFWNLYTLEEILCYPMCGICIQLIRWSYLWEVCVSSAFLGGFNNFLIYHFFLRIYFPECAFFARHGQHAIKERRAQRKQKMIIPFNQNQPLSFTSRYRREFSGTVQLGWLPVTTHKTKVLVENKR